MSDLELRIEALRLAVGNSANEDGEAIARNAAIFLRFLTDRAAVAEAGAA